MEGGCFILFQFNKDLKQAKVITEKRADFTTSAVFISKDKLCVLDQNKELNVCNFDGSNNKKIAVNKKDLNKIENIYPGPLGRILIDADDRLVLYDMSARKILYEAAIGEVKRVYWNNNFTYAAVITKKGNQNKS